MHVTLTVLFSCLLAATIPTCLGATPASDGAGSGPAGLHDAEADALSPNDDGWVVLIGEEGPTGFPNIGENLKHCGDARLNEETGEIATEPGTGVVAATRKFSYKDANNLTSAAEFGDCEVRLEFLLGEGANSGVKLQQRYEIQIYDSQGKDEPSGADCGGVYPHWVFAKSGHGITYVDQGVPPLRNAARAPGVWQTLRIVFEAPRFDSDGAKVKDARFVLVELNDEVVQRDVELDSPTGNTSDPLPEVRKAPLYLQMDHGAVAFRNVRVRPM